MRAIILEAMSVILCTAVRSIHTLTWIVLRTPANIKELCSENGFIIDKGIRPF